MNLVKVISTSWDDIGRTLVKVLRLGNKDIQTPLEATPYGTDSNPVKDMIAIYSQTQTKGDAVIIGYLNKNRLADIGEHRLFSTDSDGNLSTYVWLKNDNTMEIGGDTDNMVRYSELKSAFDELKSDFNTFVTTKYNTHVHPITVGGVTPGAGVGTGTSTPTVSSGSPSTADISGAKITEIKTL